MSCPITCEMAGRIERVLNDCNMPEFNLHAVSLSHKLPPARERVSTDNLAEVAGRGKAIGFGRMPVDAGTEHDLNSRECPILFI